MKNITPFLWFNNEAEEAAKFYTSIFKNSKIESIRHYPEAEDAPVPIPKGTVMVVDFSLNGQLFTALNGGPMYKFSPAISFMVNCDTQEEIDYFWEKLSEGGAKIECGWVTDKFGVTWQIIPAILGELTDEKTPKKAQRVMQALWKMDKIDIKTLKDAYGKE